MGSSMGREKQYIQVVKILHYKLLGIGKKLPAFPHRVQGLKAPTSEMQGECVTTEPPCSLLNLEGMERK